MLHFRVLGPFEVVDEQGPLVLGSARRRALLALLTLNAGRVVSAERLVDALWGDSPPRTAVHVLQVYVSDLRHVLPPEVLVTVPPGYALRVAEDALDLMEFERLVARGRSSLVAGDPVSASTSLRQALALWRGPVLEDLSGEGFVKVEARRLEELRLAAIELDAEAALARGGDPDLVPTLTTLVAEHPFRERPHALLMRALAATGRQAEALDLFTTVRSRLADELGIEPGAELRSAQTAVLRQEATPEPAEMSTSCVVAVASDPARLAAVARAAALPAAAGGRELVVAAVLDSRTSSPTDITEAATLADVAQRSVPVAGRSAAFRSRDLAADVASLATEHNADLVVLDAAELIGVHGTLADWVVRALSDITADVVLVPGSPPVEGLGFGVPFGGSDHDWAATELAALLARVSGSSLRVIGSLTDEDDASRLVARAGLAVQRAVGIRVEPVLAEASVAGLLAALQGVNAVIGVSERWRSEGLGPFRRQLVDAMPGTFVVRRGLRPSLLAAPAAGTRFAWSVVG